MRFKNLAAAFLFALLAATHSAPAADVAQPPEIPAPYAEDIVLSQRYNPPYRAGQELSEEQSKPVRLFHFDLPLEKAKIVEGKLDPETERLVYVKKDGKIFARFYIVKSRYSRFPEVKALLERWHIPLEQKYWAVRMQSQYTFFCWDPSDRSFDPFIVKIQKTISNEKVRNTAADGEAAVRIGSMIERHLHDDPDSSFSLFPERIASSLDADGVTFANSFRSPKPSVTYSSDIKLWTANGFFGSSKALETAKKSGKTLDQWIKTEYLPKVAEYTARMNLKYGLYPESHTQNLTLAIDEKTGKIANIVLKDFSDILLDPFALIAQGKATHDQELRGVHAPRANYIPVTRDTSKFPGNNISAFTGQSVVQLSTNPKKQSAYAQTFVENYIGEAEKITGRKIELHPWYQERLDELKDLSRIKPWDPRQGNEASPLIRDYFAAILNGVYDQLSFARLPVIQPEMKAYDQPALEEAFRQALARHEVAFPIRESHGAYLDEARRASFRYAYDGQGVIAYEPGEGTQNFIGYAYGLLDPEKRHIETKTCIFSRIEAQSH
jgi:hypothetical protein